MSAARVSGRISRALTLSLLIHLSGCENPRVRPTGSPPLREPLEVASTIRIDGFSASDLAPVGDCKVWIVGASWGLVVEVDLTAGESRVIGQLPIRVRRPRLEPGPPNQLLVWSKNTPTLGWIDLGTSTFRPIHLPSHPWTPLTAGPSVALASGMIAMAPIGDTERLRSPRPWLSAPLVWVLGHDGRLVRTLGSIPDLGGDYLSAAWSQVRLGRHEDKLLVVHLAEATLEIRSIEAGTDRSGPVTSTVELPKYLRAPKIWEEVWQPAWLLNGAQPRVYFVPQLAEARFAPDGRLFAIRNGDAKWNRSDSPLVRGKYERRGGWEVTAQWLEAYGTSGALLGTYALPEGHATRLVADGVGHLFLWGTDGNISVIRDPTGPSACQIRTPVIEIPYVDSPDGATPMGGS